MKRLSKADILGADDIRVELVEVPEWGGTVGVRVMSGADRDAYEIAIYETRKAGKDNQNVRAQLVAMTAVDESGARLFGVADIRALGAKSAAALDRVFAVAQRINRLRAEDMKELAGNSAGGPSDGSASASPPPSA